MMLKRPAFFLDTQICTGCKTCMVACKDKNNLPLSVRWRRVVEFSGGEWVRLSNGTFTQNVYAYYISVSCNHCRDPICVQSCPTTAMNQDSHGIVSVDLEKCVGCRYCEWACPYSSPQFDQTLQQMTKCDFCRDELLQGGTPSCVGACPTRALLFGEYDELVKQHGDGMVMAPMPPKNLTDPTFVQAPHKDAKPIQTDRGGIANPEEVRDE